MTIIKNSAPTVFISVGITSVESWMNRPTTIDTTRAQYTVPSQPSVTAANMMGSGRWPMFHWTFWVIPR